MSLSIQVMPTMECEPPKPSLSEYANRKSPTGPASWEAGERSVRGYVEVLQASGFNPTLFIHPAVAERQAALFLALEDAGACLALHVHPYKLDPEYTHDLGVYSVELQREILREAIARWEAAIGHHPRFIRTGGCSANDNTFRVLEEVGFVGGSVSAPGCVWPAYAAAWMGAEPYPHRAHRDYRLMRGSSEFIEVPYLGDFNRPTHTSEFDDTRGYEPPYLAGARQESTLHQTETGYPVEEITGNLVTRFIADAPVVPTLAPHVHNNADFRTGSSAARNAAVLMRTLADREATSDVEIEPATLESVIETVRVHVA